MRKWKQVAAGLVAASLVTAACGGDDGDGTDTASSSADNSTTAAPATTGGSSGGSSTTSGSSGGSANAPADEPASMEEWESLWTEQRAAIVKRIKDEGWGTSADGKTVTGPDGFTIDLSTCPSGWSNTEGLTDTSIKIGHPTALSGTLADYGNIAKAMEVVFKHYSDEGAFKDSAGKTRSVDLIVKDDGYDAARTIPLVDEMIDSDKVFSVWTLGSPNTLRTYDKLNQRCIPQPFAMTGHPAWGDPVNHPWTTGLQLAYNTEGVILGSFIEQRIDSEFDGKVKIATLVMNNDAGKAWDGALRDYINDSPRKDDIEYIFETVEPTAPTVTDAMTTLASKDPDVFIGMVAGTICPQTIIEAAQNGMKDSTDYLFMPSVCKAASFVGKDALGGDGEASNDWWIVGGGAKDLIAESAADDPYLVWARELLGDAGIDYKSSGSLGSGFGFAWPMVQALQIAGELDGGLTRSNLILAVRTLDMTNPNLLWGIKFNMNGNADAYFTEGSDVSQYDSAKQGWEIQGDVIDISGKSKNCAFDQSTSSCK